MSTTRVGVENQAKIPSLMQKYDPSELIDYGLPIPVAWVRNNQPKTRKEATESNNDLFPLPGLSTERWSAIERASFLLGIYVFEKNFCLVKNFVGSKRMRSVIGYYYCEFHKSGDHDRWSKWRKDRRKRPHYARKLFTGWSHDELLSRLSSNNVTDECKDRLIQDGRKYIEGRLSLTRFVFNLKHNVGMNLLVEAVAIGQEGRDLFEFRQISDWSYVNVEVPIGNACSSHTPQEILQILKGDVRLSKARSRDLFWDAVWPRLLARGWHSMQPRNNILQNSKNLVFLVPGVNEFPHNELKKGTHYFDSLTDVLSKVASEPELIELDYNQDPNNEEHRDYVEPDVPQTNRDLNLFTIVDISSDRDQNGVIKSMELPSLPVSEQYYIVEQGHNEQDVTNNLANHLDRKSSEHYESKPIDDTGENIGFEVKTPSGDDKHEEMVEELRLKRKHDQGNIIIDLNFSQMASDSVLVPQRQSTRSRLLSAKALEAIAFGYLSPKKKRKRVEEDPSRRVRGKTGPVSSGGAGNVENTIDGPFSGPTARLSNAAIPCRYF